MNTLMKAALLSLIPLSVLATGATKTLAQEVVVEEPYTALDVDGVVVDDDLDADVADVAVEAADDDPIIVAEGASMDRCAATFRSFDPASGTYVGYDGLVRRCPYLE